LGACVSAGKVGKGEASVLRVFSLYAGDLVIYEEFGQDFAEVAEVSVVR
jgi:hypothetical protein